MVIEAIFCISRSWTGKTLSFLRTVSEALISLRCVTSNFGSLSLVLRLAVSAGWYSFKLAQRLSASTVRHFSLISSTEISFLSIAAVTSRMACIRSGTNSTISFPAMSASTSARPGAALTPFMLMASVTTNPLNPISPFR